MPEVDEVHLAMPYDGRFCQQNGFLHGGAIASLPDPANGYAAYTLAPPGTDVLAVEFKINLLSVPGGRSASVARTWSGPIPTRGSSRP